MICRNCGANIGDSSKFCEFCGTKTEESASQDYNAYMNDQSTMGQESPSPSQMTGEGYQGGSDYQSGGSYTNSQTQQNPTYAQSGTYQPGQGYQPQQNYQAGQQWNAGQGRMTNWLVANIIITVVSLFTCSCIGVVLGGIGIVFSAMVNGRMARGDEQGAKSAANVAKVLFFCAIGMLGLMILLYVVGLPFAFLGNILDYDYSYSY